MTTQEKKSPEGADLLHKNATIVVGTILSTSARLFIPIIGLMIIGLLLDKAFLTKPWLMIAGILSGVFIAMKLIQKQLKEVRKGDKLSIDEIANLAKLRKENNQEDLKVKEETKPAKKAKEKTS